jgi:hypothetical protein
MALTSARGFEPTEVPDLYRFRLRADNRIAPPTADWTAHKEIGEFRRIERYASYEVKERRYNSTPSYYEYTVKFARP